LAARQTDN